MNITISSSNSQFPEIIRIIWKVEQQVSKMSNHFGNGIYLIWSVNDKDRNTVKVSLEKCRLTELADPVIVLGRASHNGLVPIVGSSFDLVVSHGGSKIKILLQGDVASIKTTATAFAEMLRSAV